MKKIARVLTICLDNPFHQSLKTHRVNIPTLGSVYSSRVTADLRIIWTFSPNNNIVIVAIRLQGHDTVYS